MEHKITALLVSDRGEPFWELKRALDSQDIETCQAQSGAEALVLLEQSNFPQIIFTDTTLPDGTWADVLTLAAERCVPVIVVSRLPDAGFCTDKLEPGAFDVVVPPFAGVNVAHIACSTAWKQAN